MNSQWKFDRSRRQVLQVCAAAGASLMGVGGRSRAAGSSWANLPLITRAIPSTGERLPVIGLGTDRFRNPAQRAAIHDEIARMVQMGGTVVDTAAAYGLSEELLGEALATLGIRERMFVATKLSGTRSGPGGDGLLGKQSFDRSLQRLHTQRIDLLQVHSMNGVDELMPLMQQWKQQGLIRYIGITTGGGPDVIAEVAETAQHQQMVGYMHKYPLDFVQVDYSLADRDAAKNVLPLAMQKRIGVLINVPFGFGSAITAAEALPLPAWAADIDASSWAQFLLKYVISHPAVTCAIPGSTQTVHLEDNQRAARGRLPDEATRRKMEQYWDSN